MGWLRLLFGGLIIIVNIASLVRLHNGGFLSYSEDVCHRYRGVNDGFDVKAMRERIEKVLEKMETLQLKLEHDVLKMEKEEDQLGKSSISRLKFKEYLEEEVFQPFYGARVALRQVQLPRVNGIRNREFMEKPLINDFDGEEIRKYLTPKENKNGEVNIFKTRRIYNTIGHACVLVKKELENYMNYDVGSYCKDDWNLAQKLMLQGCDPLPRRRCFTRASNESLWKIPDGRWNSYNKCRDFECLLSKDPNRGYTECIGCSEMEKETLKWVSKSSVSLSSADFLINDVLGIKPREIRIGLDYSLGTGTFAARMMEQNVTIISTALNLDLPYNQMIARRGLVPLYITPNQRLPFFENTMDLIHATGLLDGWVDMSLLDFILHDWDRVLRPGGLLWIDKFICDRQDLDDYMYMFLQFRYKKHKWIVATKSKDEVYLSALLEKPPRSV